MGKDTLIIYEGAMCCSTGVCGPEPDQTLIEFNQILKKLRGEFKDLDITRASISFNTKMFLENKEIFELVQKNGREILPITTVNGEIIARQKYPGYGELKEILNKL